MNIDDTALETMTCDELLRLLAKLSAAGDHLNAEVGTPAQADAEHQDQARDLVTTRHRIDRISDLLLAKGCVGEQG